MGTRILRLMLRHRGVMTASLLLGLLVNLVVIGTVDPKPLDASSLPAAGQCQGGGAGCAEQPLIPPPAVGLPHFDAPPAPVFGALILVVLAALVALHPSPPPRLERPPRALAFA